MTYKIILPVLCTAFMLSCNNHTAAEHTSNNAKEKTAKINVKLTDLATPKDWVCGMDLTEDMINDTTSYEGKLYGFCHVGCKEEFLKNPTSYLTQK